MTHFELLCQLMEAVLSGAGRKLTPNREGSGQEAEKMLTFKLELTRLKRIEETLVKV